MAWWSVEEQEQLYLYLSSEETDSNRPPGLILDRKKMKKKKNKFMTYSAFSVKKRAYKKVKCIISSSLILKSLTKVIVVRCK
jgi:hypothetical protein